VTFLIQEDPRLNGNGPKNEINTQQNMSSDALLLYAGVFVYWLILKLPLPLIKHGLEERMPVAAPSV
jgi:hypothetical protein